MGFTAVKSGEEGVSRSFLKYPPFMHDAWLPGSGKCCVDELHGCLALFVRLTEKLQNLSRQPRLRLYIIDEEQPSKQVAAKKDSWRWWRCSHHLHFPARIFLSAQTSRRFVGSTSRHTHTPTQTHTSHLLSSQQCVTAASLAFLSSCVIDGF